MHRAQNESTGRVQSQSRSWLRQSSRSLSRLGGCWACIRVFRLCDCSGLRLTAAGVEVFLKSVCAGILTQTTLMAHGRSVRMFDSEIFNLDHEDSNGWKSWQLVSK